MKTFWLVAFVLSLTGLLAVLARAPLPSRWLKAAGFHLFLAVAMLYGFQFLEHYIPVHLPINLFTVLVTAVLGVPGLVMLAALKAVLF